MNSTTWMPPVARSVTGVVLAGGRGSRMGGVDKGLQTFHGAPLAWHALTRLQQQQGDWIGACMINANRHIAVYEGFGVPVWPDVLPDYPGPLAGMLTALVHADTPYVLTVPCDSPRYPLDLAERLCKALIAEQAELALAVAPDDDGTPRPQPVFCLLSATLLESLQAFVAGGGRKIDRWTAQHRCALVPFDQSGDDPLAFANVNTLDELHRLQQAQPPATTHQAR
jgi:molybdopterin-guanine dinucleotide biosynthesis protein A